MRFAKIVFVAPSTRQGQLMRMGADMAIDEINQSGGIKALGGAKLVLVVADAGDSTEKAKNAAQRLLSDQPDLSGGFGAWLASWPGEDVVGLGKLARALTDGALDLAVQLFRFTAELQPPQLGDQQLQVFDFVVTRQQLFVLREDECFQFVGMERCEIRKNAMSGNHCRESSRFSLQQN